MSSTDHRPRGAAALALLLSAAFFLTWTACGPAREGADEPAADPGAVEPMDPDPPSPSAFAAPILRTRGIDPPAAPGSMAPELILVRDDAGAETAALTWLEPRETESAGPAAADRAAWALRFARWVPSDGWTEPVTITAESSTETGTAEPARFFANWADRPGAVQAPDGTLYAHWLAMNGDAVYTYEVRMARSDDRGGTWTPLGRLHTDDSPAEHGFVSYAVDREADSATGAGAVHAFWLDGRATVDGRPMTLRTARLGGESGVDRGSETLLDDSVCDCCSTTAVTTATGPLVVYRDRTEAEVRDHSTVRGVRAGGGIDWSEPAELHPDGWQIAACPVNGPAAGRLEETVWVAWFTAEGGEPRVLGAVSADGGRTFGKPVTIDAGDPLGRLALEVIPLAPDAQEDRAGAAVISWLDREDGDGGSAEAAIRLRRLTTDGRLGPTVTAARTTGSRSSGVPRLLALAGSGADSDAGGVRLLVAWVDPGGDERPRTLRVAELPASAIP